MNPLGGIWENDRIERWTNGPIHSGPAEFVFVVLAIVALWLLLSTPGVPDFLLTALGRLAWPVVPFAISWLLGWPLVVTILMALVGGIAGLLRSRPAAKRDRDG